MTAPAVRFTSTQSFYRFGISGVPRNRHDDRPRLTAHVTATGSVSSENSGRARVRPALGGLRLVGTVTIPTPVVRTWPDSRRRYTDRHGLRARGSESARSRGAPFALANSATDAGRRSPSQRRLPCRHQGRLRNHGSLRFARVATTSRYSARTRVRRASRLSLAPLHKSINALRSASWSVSDRAAKARLAGP